MTRTLVLFSGGLDSVTLAVKLKREGHEVFGLFVDRGQGNLERELQSVEYFKTRLPIDVSRSATGAIHGDALTACPTRNCRAMQCLR